MTTSRTAERGQALPLLALVLVLAAAVAIAVGDVGVAAVERAEARTAADAAALAGAAEGEQAAREVAAANGGELVGYAVAGPRVEVVVRVGRARARATAEGAPAFDDLPIGVDPATAAALARAQELLGRTVPVVGVGETGRGVDVDPSAADALDAVAAVSGLCRQPAAAGPVHFAPCPPTRPG